MRVVFRFCKGGPTRYISHLDLMRAMNRAIRRAGLPAAYSQGFHPHIVMAFAQALGLGYLSEGEYMEIALDDGYSLEMAVASLNAALPEGIRMTAAWPLAKEFPTLMAAVTAARWRLDFDAPVGEEALSGFTSLLAREAVDVVKEGRNGPAHADIRPGIYTIEGVGGGVELFLAAGSERNVRPELVASAALGDARSVKTITRLELYSSVSGRQTPFHEIFGGEDLYEHGKNNIG